MYLEKEEVKFIILYVLKKYEAPITADTLYGIVSWDKAVMNFFDAAEAVAELFEVKYIEEKFYRGEKCYALTTDGMRAIEIFGEKFPKSIQNRIDKTIDEMRYDELSDPNAALCEVLPVNHTSYAARFTYLQKHTPMLELSLNAGDKRQAEAVLEYMKEHKDEIYGKILEICMPKED